MISFVNFLSVKKCTIIEKALNFSSKEQQPSQHTKWYFSLMTSKHLTCFFSKFCSINQEIILESCVGELTANGTNNQN